MQTGSRDVLNGTQLRTYRDSEREFTKRRQFTVIDDTSGFYPGSHL